MPISFPSSVTATVSNSSLDVHCYASSNGTDWHHLKSDSNGVLNTHSMMQDGQGNDIGSKQYPSGTGTAYGLSVNLASQEQNFLVDVNLKQIQAGITAYISNPLSITGYTFSTTHDGTQLATNNSSLNTASIMYSLGDAPGGGIGLSIIESTPINMGSGNRNNLLVYDKTIGTLINTSNTNLTTINSSVTALHSDNLSIISSITALHSDNLTIISSITGGNSTLTQIYSGITGTNNTLTQIYSGITSINSKLVQQYDTTNTKIGGYNITGLNVYQILPKVRSFSMSGTNPNGSVSDTLLGGAGTTLRVDTTSFGYANQKTFYAFSPTGSTLRTLSYTFINSSGVESSTATTITATNTYQALFTGCGINELKFNGNVNPGANDLVYITINTVSNVNNVASMNIRNHFCGVFTAPSNCIAQVVSIDYNMATAGDQLFMNIYGADGNRSVIYAGYFYQTGVNNFRASESGIGRIIQPLETVCFSSWSTSTVNKYLYFTVLVKYF